MAGTKLKDEDYVTDIIHTSAHAYLLFFSNLGRVYRLKAHQIPMMERTARGTALVNLLQLQPERARPGRHRHPRLRDPPVPVLRDPRRRREEDPVQRVRLVRARPGSSPWASVTATSWCGCCRPTTSDEIMVVSQMGQGIRFAESDVRPMGRHGVGRPRA